MSVSIETNIRNQIEVALSREIERVREEIIHDAAELFESRIREVVAKVALNVANYYSIESIGNVLHVKIQASREA